MLGQTIKKVLKHYWGILKALFILVGSIVAVVSITRLAMAAFLRQPINPEALFVLAKIAIILPIVLSIVLTAIMYFFGFVFKTCGNKDAS